MHMAKNWFKSFKHSKALVKIYNFFYIHRLMCNDLTQQEVELHIWSLTSVAKSLNDIAFVNIDLITTQDFYWDHKTDEKIR